MSIVEYETLKVGELYQTRNPTYLHDRNGKPHTKLGNDIFLVTDIFYWNHKRHYVCLFGDVEYYLSEMEVFLSPPKLVSSSDT